MLIPDNIHPKNTVYYNATFVLEALKKRSPITVLDLYVEINSTHEMSISLFILCLDWLFLLGLVSIDEEGRIKQCT